MEGGNEDELFGSSSSLRAKRQSSISAHHSESSACAYTQFSLPSITNLVYKCIHYQAHRLGAIFLLWSSSRIHQPHTHIYLQIIGKAAVFNYMCKVVVICLNTPLKNVDSWASVGNRGVWITILHDFINRRSLHYHVCLQSGNLLDV